jgi:hypothetical protein
MGKRRSFKEFQRNIRAFFWDIRWGIISVSSILILLVAAIWGIALGVSVIVGKIDQSIEDKKAEWTQFSRKHDCHLVKDAIIYREYQCEDGAIYLKLLWED